MKILAVDTATNCCGVAVTDDTGVKAHSVRISRETHSHHLLSMIDQVLHLANSRPKDISGLAVTRGPGSFTGLRIGLSTVKGLSVAWDQPVVTVSTLDALAGSFLGSALPVCALIDARKGEVYVCRYRVAKMALEKLTAEEVLSPRVLMAGISGPCLFVGSGAVVYRELITDMLGSGAIFAPAAQNFIRPEIVADIGRRRLTENRLEAPESLTPVYIRQPDAVMNQKQLQTANGVSSPG